MNQPPLPAGNIPVRILVVDDHPNTATTLARAIAQLGPKVDVVSATSGYEALKCVKDRAVDILITDMIMPDMTGLELIEHLQNHPAGRPVFSFLMTAYDVLGLKVTAHRLKVKDVIVKPVHPERICEIITQAIQEMNQEKPARKEPALQKSFNILVADDQPDNFNVIGARYLENEGYGYSMAKDGLETLEKARNELPDLILLDVNMPHKDGFAVLKEIREDPAIQHIPVIILTAARLAPTEIQSGLNMGADDYVTKPFDRRELFARIRTKLRVKEADDVIRRRNRQLSLLLEIGRELSAHTDIKDLANVLLTRSVETLEAIQGNMILLNSAQGVQQNYQVSLSTSEPSSVEMLIPERLLKHIHASRQSLIIEDTRNDPFWQADLDTSIRSAVIVPLHGRCDLLGLLILTHKEEQYFNMEHLLLLQAIASQAAITIENARLYSETAQEQKRLAALLKQASEAILMFDAQGKLSLLNSAGEKLFADLNTKINQPLLAGHGYDMFIQLLGEVRSSELEKSGEVLWPDQRTFMTLITPIEDGGQVVTLQDVTRFKDLDKIKNNFIATASHALKNPITSISGFIHLLEHAGPLNPKQKEFLSRIQGTAHAMNELIHNMMQLAQLDLALPHLHLPMEMNTLLSEIMDEFLPRAQAKDQTLNFIPLPEDIPVTGDLLQLRQVFRNLVGNAIKYTPVGGSIALSSEINDGKLIVRIQDTGYGIPIPDLPFIFDRFYRVRKGRNTEEEGNGLGLAMVKSIAEQHSGHVTVESEPGKGSCFIFTLPLIAEPDRSTDGVKSISISDPTQAGLE